MLPSSLNMPFTRHNLSWWSSEYETFVIVSLHLYYLAVKTNLWFRTRVTEYRGAPTLHVYMLILPLADWAQIITTFFLSNLLVKTSKTNNFYFFILRKLSVNSCLIWFSCGATSTLLLKWVVHGYDLYAKEECLLPDLLLEGWQMVLLSCFYWCFIWFVCHKLYSLVNWFVPCRDDRTLDVSLLSLEFRRWRKLSADTNLNDRWTNQLQCILCYSAIYIQHH